MGLLDDFWGKENINQLKKSLLEKDAQLKQTLAEKDAQLNQILAELKEAETRRAIVEWDVVKQKSIITQREEALLDRDKRLECLHERCANLVLDVEELGQKAADQRQNIDQLTDKIAQQETVLESVIQRSSAHLIEAQEHASRLELALQALTAELSALKSQNATLQFNYDRDRNLYIQKDQELLEREARLAQESQDLKQEKEVLQKWANRLDQQERHWIVEIVPQVERYTAHKQLDQRQIELSDFNISLAALHDELLEKDQRLKQQQTDVEQRTQHLEEWARDLFSLQGRVNSLDADSRKFAERVLVHDAKERSILIEYSQKQSELREMKNSLKREANELDVRLIELDAREQQVSRREDQQEKLKAKFLDLKRELTKATSEIEVLSNEKIQALAALRKVDSKYKALLSIQVTSSGDPIESSFSHPRVLEWLLEGADPKSAYVNNGWLGITGHGPWGSGELEAALDDLGYVRYLLPDGDLDHLIVGRNDWSKTDLLNQIDARKGARLRVYSQEMFFAKLVTGNDPFDAGDPDLLGAFAEDHPALQFLMSLPEPWPEIFVGLVGDGGEVGEYRVSESPLHIYQYKVGLSSGLTVSKRRKLLSSFFEDEALEFSHDSDDEYISKWGQPGTAQRLHRMAAHMKSLIDGPVGKTKPHARADWIEDMKWLKEQYFERFRRKFSWPGDGR